MKINPPVLAILLMVFIFSCKNEKQKEDPGTSLGSLHISKEKPQPGDQLELTYSEDKPDISDSTELKGFYHYFVGPKAIRKTSNSPIPQECGNQI